MPIFFLLHENSVSRGKLAKSAFFVIHLDLDKAGSSIPNSSIFWSLSVKMIDFFHREISCSISCNINFCALNPDKVEFDIDDSLGYNEI